MRRFLRRFASVARSLLADFLSQILAALALLLAIGVWLRTGSLIGGLVVLGVAVLVGAPICSWVEGERKRRSG